MKKPGAAACAPAGPLSGPESGPKKWATNLGPRATVLTVRTVASWATLWPRIWARILDPAFMARKRTPKTKAPQTSAAICGASSCARPLPCHTARQAMAQRGVWTRLAEDGSDETASALSLLSPSEREPANTHGAGGSAAVPSRHCFGHCLCPWCIFGCSADEHGQLDVAAIKFHMAEAEASKPTCFLTPVEETCIMGGLKFFLLAAAIQCHKRGPSPADASTIERLQSRAILPPTATWPTCGTAAPSAQPDPPGTTMDTEEDEGGEGSKKKRGNKKTTVVE